MKLEAIRVIAQTVAGLESLRHERLAAHSSRVAKLNADIRQLKAKRGKQGVFDSPIAKQWIEGKHKELEAESQLNAIYEVDDIAGIGEQIRSLFKNSQSLSFVVNLMNYADMVFIALAHIHFEGRYDFGKCKKDQLIAEKCLEMLRRYSDRQVTPITEE